jgi:paraquat-inducible protein A
VRGFGAVNGSLAGRARGRARLLGPLQWLLLAALPVAWTAPLFTARVPFLWRQEVSIASGLVELWRLDRLLFLAVLLFAVITPALKAALQIWLWYRAPAGSLGRWGRRLALLGKLAMTEIFLVAVAIVGFKGVGLGEVETGWGLWWLTGVVLAGLALSLWLERGIERAVMSAP